MMRVERGSGVGDDGSGMNWQRGDNVRLQRGRGRARPARGLGSGFFAFVAAAVGLLAGSIMFPSVIGEVRTRAQSFVAPGLAGGVAMFAPVRALGTMLFQVTTASRDLERLRLENQELRGWKWRAGEAERKLKDLRALAKVVRRPGVGFVTAQLLAVSPGLARHTIMIDAGVDHGLRPGDAVINGDGLVGVVAQATPYSARVRLLDDPDSRVGVAVGRDGVLGALVGDRSGLARLEPLDQRAVFRAGDQVVTSGSVPGMPRGLRVGMVVQEGGGMRVAPYAALAKLEYVSVLLRPKALRERIVDGKPFAEPVRASDRRIIVPAGGGNERRRVPGRF